MRSGLGQRRAFWNRPTARSAVGFKVDQGDRIPGAVVFQKGTMRRLCRLFGLILSFLFLFGFGLCKGKEPPLKISQFKQNIDAIDFSPDGKLLASAGIGKMVQAPGYLVLWDLTTGLSRTVIDGHRAGLQAVAFSPNGRLIAVGGNDGEAKLWDVDTGKLRSDLVGHARYNPLDLSRDPRYVTCMSFSSNGKFLATGSTDDTVKIWEVPTGKQKASFSIAFPPRTRGNYYGIERVSLSRDGEYVAVGACLKHILLIHIPTRKEIRIPHEKLACPVLFSPDGELLASGTGSLAKERTVNRVYIWDWKKRKLICSFPAHPQVRCLSFSADGNRLASGGVDDDFLRVYDLGKRKEISTIHVAEGWAPISLALSPDGKTLAAVVRNQIKLWNVDTRKEVKPGK
jgi:WD40 repeat protein